MFWNDFELKVRIGNAVVICGIVLEILKKTAVKLSL
jgi:hypothetical protein